MTDKIKNLKKLLTRQSLLDIAVQIENFLDDMNLYVYPNWFNGEIVTGPEISRYWVTIVLKYDYKDMPDPAGALVLNKVGVVTKFKTDIEKDPVYVQDPSDWQPGTKKPKLEPNKIWLVTLQIPRRVIDEADIDDLDLFSNDIDVDDVIDAEDHI